jgi:peptide/nickel transport system permease protein
MSAGRRLVVGPGLSAFLARRVLALLPVAFGVSVVTFILLQLTPGRPADILLPPDATEAARVKFTADYHLNAPVYQRFVSWLEHAVRGDFGQSIASGGFTARYVFWQAMRNTLELVAAGGVLALIFGITMGMATAWWSNTRFDRAARLLIAALVSMPAFWVGLVLIYIFGVKLHLLPTGGTGPVIGGGGVGTTLRYLVLPAVTVAILPGAFIARLTRALFLEVLNQEFVLALRTRGYSVVRIWRHLLRNAAAGVVNIAGLQMGYLLLGTLFVEVVFAWPGIGSLLERSISFRDYPVIEVTILGTGVLFAFITMLVDVMMRFLDPRVET